MDDFELEPKPIYSNSSTKVSIFRGLWKERNLPVVVKRHDCTTTRMKSTIEKVNDRISEGLIQARLSHKNSLRLYEIRFEVPKKKNIDDKDSFVINHVMESMDNDILEDIIEHSDGGTEYSERELLDFLTAIGSAVYNAHSSVSGMQKIAHRDIKPANILVNRDRVYKLGDFGCAWEKKDTSMTISAAGSIPYMSPQLRQTCLGFDVKYSAFKADVFALGASMLHMATLSPPSFLCQIENLDENIFRSINKLTYSDDFKDLLIAMMKTEEKHRLSMEDVMSRLGAISILPTDIGDRFIQPEEVPQKPEAEQLFALTSSEIYSFDIEHCCWSFTSPLSKPIVCDNSSRYTVLSKDQVFCCGAGPSNGDIGNILSRVQAEQDCAYLIQVRQAEESLVQVMPRMGARRVLPGLVSHEGSVYVFGGTD